MARIGFVASYSDGGRSGIGQYETNLARRLPRFGGAHEFVIFARKDEADSFRADGLEIITYPAKYKSPLKNLYWHHTGLHRLAKKARLDLLHLSTQQRLVWRRPCRVTATINDLGTYHIENKYGRLRDFYLKKFGPLCARRADALISISEFTKKDLVELWKIDPRKIEVIPDGIDEERFAKTDPAQGRAALTKRFSLPEKYFLYIARLDHPSKNHVNLLEAFRIFRERSDSDCGLVLAGSKWYSADVIFARTEELGLKDSVVFTDFVADADMPALISGAAVFVFPSLFEGFGIPPLEAMAAGVPVACSNVAAIPEVVGDAALTYDPRQPERIAEALLRITGDDGLRRSLIEKGEKRAAQFTWDNTARATVEFFDRVLAGHYDT